MKLVDQWSEVEAGLPEGWEDVRLTLRTEQHAELARAAQVLGPTGAGRVGDALVLRVRRAGGASGPEGVRRLFSILDRERVWCTLEAGETTTAAPAAPAPDTSLASQWDAALATLPQDWSDLLGAVDVGSTDVLPLASLRCAPLNPTRDPEIAGFVFRCARRAGYGASPAMVRRCLERLDEEGVGGTVEVRRLLSETGHVATQGPVWVVGGRMV